MYKSILLATDGSDHAEKATRVAADLAAKYGAKLTIVNVLNTSLTLDQLEHMPQAGRFPQNVREDMQRFRDTVTSQGRAVNRPSVLIVPAPFSAIVELGEEILNQAEEVAKGAGVKDIERFTLDGHPADAIVEAANKAEADLIVMGTRGLTDLKGIFMGSVSHKVIHLADCACLTVK